jgi:hypothetical protein
MTSIQSVSTAAIAPIQTAAVPLQQSATEQPPVNTPTVGSGSAANVPSAIASLSLRGAADDDSGASQAAGMPQGAYGMPDQDGDNDGK